MDMEKQMQLIRAGNFKENNGEIVFSYRRGGTNV